MRGRRPWAAPALFAAGALLGVASKFLDLYTTELGNIFSELSVWILLGTLISLYSRTPGRAALHVFLFCAGMVAAYYLTAELTGSVYSLTFVYGWCVFTLFCPLFAWVTWHAKGKKPAAKVLSAGIICVSLAGSALLFHGPRWYDLVIAAALFYLLFVREIKRR